MLTRRFLFAFLLSLMIPLMARAGVMAQVSSTVTYNPVDSDFDYLYLLTNPSENSLLGDPLFFDFSIEISSLANLTDITTPGGWFNTYSAGDTLVEWGVDIGNGGVGLTPGQSLAFSFSSMLSRGDSAYGVVFVSDVGGDFVSGMTQAPIDPIPISSVPEPSSLTMFTILAAGFFGCRRRSGSLSPR